MMDAPGEMNEDADPNRRRLAKIAYVRQMLGELRTVADAEGCAMLSYLIEMAYIEATDIEGQLKPSKTPRH